MGGRTLNRGGVAGRGSIFLNDGEGKKIAYLRKMQSLEKKSRVGGFPDTLDRKKSDQGKTFRVVSGDRGPRRDDD